MSSSCVSLLLLFVVATLGGGGVDAKHMRYVTLKWSRSSVESTSIDAHIESGWRWDWQWEKTKVRDIDVITSPESNRETTLWWGDGTKKEFPSMNVFSRSGWDEHSWVLSDYKQQHKYEERKAYTIKLLDGCCRIVTLVGGNENAPFRAQAVVDLASDQLAGPAVAGIPIVTMIRGRDNVFRVTPLNYPHKLSVKFTSRTASKLRKNPHPGQTIRKDQQISWKVPKDQKLGLYAQQVTLFVEGSKTSTPLDFIIDLRNDGDVPPPPVFQGKVPRVLNEHVEGLRDAEQLVGRVRAFVGVELELVIRSTHTNTEKKVNMSNSQLPRGATLSPCTEGEERGFSPTHVCTRILRWTPDADQTQPFNLLFVTLSSDALQSEALQDTIVPFLTPKGVLFGPLADEPAENKTDIVPAVLATVGGLFLAALLAAFLWHRRKRNRDKMSGGSAPEHHAEAAHGFGAPQPTPQQKPRPSNIHDLNTQRQTMMRPPPPGTFPQPQQQAAPTPTPTPKAPKPWVKTPEQKAMAMRHKQAEQQEKAAARKAAVEKKKADLAVARQAKAADKAAKQAEKAKQKEADKAAKEAAKAAKEAEKAKPAPPMNDSLVISFHDDGTTTNNAVPTNQLPDIAETSMASTQSPSFANIVVAPTPAGAAYPAMREKNPGQDMPPPSPAAEVEPDMESVAAYPAMRTKYQGRIEHS